MKVAVFSSKNYDIKYLNEANEAKGNMHELSFFEPRLTSDTLSMAYGYKVISAFVNDRIDRNVLEKLKKNGTEMIAMRSAGFNNVDIKAAKEFGISITRVPAYSPNAVAEHTVALILALNRKVHKAYNRVREGNFSLDGLMGFDLAGKTVGIIGTGKIGQNVARILKGFDTKIIAYDKYKNPEFEKYDAEYTDLDTLFEKSDIISLHCPLLPETYHIINKRAIGIMKEGVMIINTSRGELIDTLDVVEGLKNRKIGYLGLDVYEEEEDLFFKDMSDIVITDDVFSRLITFPNVIVTGHQAFFTENAIKNISEVTINSITEFENSETLTNEIII
ncbi:MAG: 2-hydroxyacid dehydrogenase [Thermotogae bacterium]|nr:2-hydroxyacid dehydrogenase [Thermotogota bacterium]